jgi:hypothetical protein
MKRARRGGGIAAVVMMLALLNLVILGAVAASGDEAHVGAMRAETSRAFYAAESGAVVVLKLTSENRPLPAPGSTIAIGSATAEFVSLPATGQPGEAVIQGRSGDGARRLRITVTNP